MSKRLNLKFCFLILFVMICCSACNGNITRDIRHGGYSIAGELNCSPFYPANKDDTDYEKIKYFTGNHIVTKNGELYELSLSQKYTSGENCRKASTDIVVSAIMDNVVVKGDDGYFYTLVSDKDINAYSKVPDEKVGIYELLMRDNDVVKVQTVDNSAGVYYILKTDGNVYSYTLTKNNYNSPQEIQTISIAFDKANYDGGIVDFSYSGDQSLSTFILTNNKLYRVRATNLEECSKYADIACKYKMMEDLTYEKYKDIIIAYNGSTLITNYKKMFSVAN